MPFAHETNMVSMPMVGYSYVPIQQAEMRNIYDPEQGLARGTIFPILDKPFGVYGKQVNGDVIFSEVEK
ncbi:MAG: spore coat associated protein CotJA [Oscillospiraceae bacterium]